MFCTNCGEEIADDSKFCRKCGTPVEPLDDNFSEEKYVDDNRVFDDGALKSNNKNRKKRSFVKKAEKIELKKQKN